MRRSTYRRRVMLDSYTMRKERTIMIWRYVRCIALATALLCGARGLGARVAPAARAIAAPLHARLYAGLQDGIIYVSDDGGVTWREADTGIGAGADVLALAAVQSGSGVVYAGTDGRGVYVSRDNGESWQRADGGNAALAGAQVTALAVDPKQGRPVYAVTADGNFYRSVGGGANWVGQALPVGSRVNALAIDPLRSTTIVVGTVADGMLISTDGGASWNAPAIGVPQNVSVNALAFSSSSADVAYAATDAGIYQTIDGGATWHYEGRATPDGAPLQSVAVDPAHGSHVLAGGDDGQIFRSLDGGTSWREGSIGDCCATVTALLINPAGTAVTLAGTTDGTVFRGVGGGTAWTQAVTPFAAGSSVLSMAAAPAPPARGVQYFPQAGHTVRGAFLAFYRRYGGLRIFGLPLTDAFTEQGQRVQYFERARLVLAGTRVRISPLGAWLTAGRRFPPVAPFHATPSARYFPATHQALTGAFLVFWQRNQGALLFGAPISGLLHEQNGDGTGRTYLVQYFQNARMEYHPELAGTRYAVTLGLLGQQYLKRRGWL